MAEVTYEKLQNNIAEESINGNTVSVTFKCPATEKTFNSSAGMPRKTGVAAKVKQGTKNELMRAAKRGFRSLLSGVFGSGTAGRAATNVATSATPNATAGADYDQKQGVVNAFKTVAKHFVWDAGHNAFVDASEMEGMLSDYDRQLRDNPLVTAWDRGVMARMIAEIVAADGKIEDEEKDFFASFVSEDTGTLDEIIEKGPLNRVEMDEVTANSRATMLMIATSVALCDENLDATEQEKLAQFAQWFDVRAERQELLRQWASEKVIESMLEGCYEDGELDDDEKKRVAELAQNIGVNEALVAKLDVRVRKRGGIV